MVTWLVSLSSEYLNADLYNPAMKQLNLTQLDLPDCSKTLVWCSHVLQCIVDDKLALSELYRILCPGGLLVLQVPLVGEKTKEELSLEPSLRMKEHFHETNVRLYGRDLKHRLEGAGFCCTIVSTLDLPEHDRRQYSLSQPMYSNDVFLCERPATEAGTLRQNA